MRKLYISLIIIFLSVFANAQSDEDRWVDSVYNSLTAEQRVGQLVNVRTNLPNKAYFVEIQQLIKKYNIGGVTFSVPTLSLC